MAALTPDETALFERAAREHAARRFELAEKTLRELLARKPDHPPALANLAEVLRASGQLAAALVAFARAIDCDPNNPLLRNNHGSALLQAGRVGEAIAELQKSLQLDPEQTRARNNLGNALLALGRFEEAAALFEQVLATNPDSVPALASLGAARVQLGTPASAIPPLVRAIELSPQAAEARTTLAGALASIGLIDESLQQYRAALAQQPELLAAWSPMIFTLHHGGGADPKLVSAESFRFGAALARSVAAETRASWKSDRDLNRRLRVGFVSADLRNHPVGFFLAPVLEALDRNQLELFAYSDARRSDETQARLRTATNLFRETASLSDSSLADQIETDQIDLLIDLAGHTTRNRLAVFARHPAPVQMSWLGYPDTTGLSAIGWRITDAVADPIGAGDARYTEKLLRLPHCFIAWRAERAAIPREQISEAPVFCCFNNIAKFSPRVAALWSRILLAVPGSTLLLKSRGLSIREVRERVLSWFAASGFSRERISILELAPNSIDGLRDYARADIALDPFPYNGTTTSCEALSAGLPLIALRGESHAARVSASILESIGERALIANSESEYLRIAIELANDRARLARLRSDLPERFARSPAGNPARLARELETAFRFAWSQFVESSPAAC